MLTNIQLHSIIPFASKINIDKYLPYFNEVFYECFINTKLRQAAFIAQVAHESGNLHYVEELADGSQYDKRKDLGNTEPTAIQIAKSANISVGKFYKGHGLIQITGYYNHLACGEDLAIDAIHNPRLLCTPEYAVKSAAWFWNKHKLSDLADIQEFDKITKIINGGFNGKIERDAFYAKAKQVLVC
jgi:putative chitinase